MIEIEQLLARTMGMDMASVGGALQRAVRGRMEHCDVRDPEAYLARLSNDPRELQELAEDLIVPETWFFRNPEAIAAMVELVNREWLPRHPQGALNVLSVPCSTGEEPYSIAIALAEAGLPRDRTRIDALDISQRAIARAERGIYGPNSFRDAGASDHVGYLQAGPGGIQVSQAIRSAVSFANANLASPHFRPPQSRYDVIFCRNVLIYFERPVQEQAIDMLRGFLADDGFLFVGPAEAMLAAERGFTATGYRMAFAFRKGGKATATRSVERQSARPLAMERGGPMPVEGRSARTFVHPKVPIAAPVAAPQAAAPAAAAVPADDLDAARQLADTGKLREAAARCDGYVRDHPASVAGWYLAGLVRDAMGEPERAAECYRKVLFLEPDHAESLGHLSLFARARGDAAMADRLDARARGAERKGADRPGMRRKER